MSYTIIQIKNTLKRSGFDGYDNIRSKEDLIDYFYPEKGFPSCSNEKIRYFLKELGYNSKELDNQPYNYYIDFIKKIIDISDEVTLNIPVDKRHFTIYEIQQALKNSDIYPYPQVVTKDALMVLLKDMDISGAYRFRHTNLVNFLKQLGYSPEGQYGYKDFRFWIDFIRKNVLIDVETNNDSLESIRIFPCKEINSAWNKTSSSSQISITSKDELMNIITKRDSYWRYYTTKDELLNFLIKLGFKAISTCQTFEWYIDFIKDHVQIGDNSNNLENNSIEENTTYKRKIPDEIIEEKEEKIEQKISDELADFEPLIKNNYLTVVDSSFYDITNTIKFYYKNVGNKKVAVDVTHTDNIWLQFNKNFNQKIKQIFIITSVDNDNKPLAYGSFLIKDDKYYFELSSKNIHFDFSSNNRVYKIIFLNIDGKIRYGIDFEAGFEELPVDDDHVLCIDFGTSNTSAGTWGDIDQQDIKLVTFDNRVDLKEIKYSNLLPTMAYIKHADLEHNEYTMLFGYEALKYLKDNDYTTEGSFFLNLKQWLSADLDYKVDCKDEDKHFFKISTKDIISSYLKYVVNLSEIKLKKHYVKLHFSAPVKLKNKFNTLVNSIFNEENGYEVIPEKESLDEGIAVVYNYISLQKKLEIVEKTGKIMVIDCGGGTTDIARCEYEFDKNDMGIEAKIRTKFVNSYDFGGNQLTFLIFQLLKIKLSEYYKNLNNDSNSIKISIGEFFNKKGDDYLKYIDDCVRNGSVFGYYENLNKASQKAESVLPTDFKNEQKGTNYNSKAYRNYIYLWDLAERIKIKFFTNYDLASLRFKEEEELITDKSLYFYIDSNWVVSGSKSEFTKTNGVPNIEINNKELAILLSPQIYYTLSLIIPDSDELLLSGTQIHLSGQSSKIYLFKDLLKEFIPGRRTRNFPDNASLDKKLDCVKGCIQCLKDKFFGKIYPKFIIDTPNIPFCVSTIKGSDDTKIELFNGEKIRTTEGNLEMLRIPIVQRTLSYGGLFLLVNNTSSGCAKDEYKDTIKLKYDLKKAEKLDSLSSFIDRIKDNALKGLEEYKYYEDKNDEISEEPLLERLERDLDNIESNSSGKLLIFALPNNDGCGFILYQLAKLKEKGSVQYYLTGEDMLYYEKIKNKSF